VVGDAFLKLSKSIDVCYIVDVARHFPVLHLSTLHFGAAKYSSPAFSFLVFSSSPLPPAVTSRVVLIVINMFGRQTDRQAACTLRCETVTDDLCPSVSQQHKKRVEQQQQHPIGSLVDP